MLHQHASSALQAACTGPPELSPDLRYEYGPDRPFQPSKRIASHLVAGFGYSLNGKRFVNVPVKYAPILKGREEDGKRKYTYPGNLFPKGTVGHARPDTDTHGIEPLPTAGGAPSRQAIATHTGHDESAALHIAPHNTPRRQRSDRSSVIGNLSATIPRAIGHVHRIPDARTGNRHRPIRYAPKHLRCFGAFFHGMPLQESPRRTRETFGYRHVCGPERLPAHFSHSPCVQTMRIQRTTATAEAPVFSMLT